MAKQEISKEDEAIANARVEKAKERIAKALMFLETSSQELKWACASMGWNDEVAYELDEAATKLGYSLATLVTWDEDLSDEC